MDSLAWFAKRRLFSAIHREYDWVFAFDGDAQLVVSCLWRLLESNRIRFTSEDEGQKFGLPLPVDAAAELNRRIANASVETVILRPHTLDLEMHFSTGHVLQVIPDSSGYEAWIAYNGNRQYIADGGGRLSVLDTPAVG